MGGGGDGGGGVGGERMYVCVYARRYARTLTLHKNHHHLALDDAVDWRGETAYLAETVMNFDTNFRYGLMYGRYSRKQVSAVKWDTERSSYNSVYATALCF